MKLGEKEKIVALGILFVALAAVIVFLLWQEREISKEEFAGQLLSAEKIGILMDLRGASPAGRDSIMNCGVELAGSSGLAEKEKLVYAFEGDSCVTTEGNKTIDECIMEMRDAVILRVSYGNNTPTFFEKRAEIRINESYGGECRIERGQGVNSSINSS